MDRKNFTLLATRDLKEIDGTASLWRHNATNAQILSIVNNDENKCFGVSFRTPPTNSTGVAHIMEHSVLCGSEKYPVKEPFVELLKGSLHTFLNAFTFPDKTCYPVASANLQDFYNLIDVYIDAVFHPLITEDIFKQEGWHLEAQSPDEPWIYKGVVYNEMKGSYSSPESVLAEQTQQALFPDMLYSFDSGGDPEKIPELTYQAFVDFHKSYYHPSNARFFFWGDDPEDERFNIIEKALQGYDAREIDSSIPLQKPFDTPRLREVAYAAAGQDQKAMFSTSWLLAERGNVKEAMLMEMLEHILEGLPGSPLRRALIASGLGEDTIGHGLETDLRQMFYSTGLKGLAATDVTKAETLIFDTLAELATNGIDKSDVEAAVNSVEFVYRERNTGFFPRGLVAMIQALSTWLYDGDPLEVLAWEEPLAEIKQRLANGEPVFEDLIRTRFLENKHRSTVVLVPDTKLGAQREENEASRVAKEQAKFDAKARADLVKETQRLQAKQLAPDNPEDLAKIPSLSVSDLPKENQIIPERICQTEPLFLAHPQPTQGIAYAKLLLPLGSVPKELLPLLPIFARTLTEMGTAKHDFISLGAQIAAKTGGISGACLTGNKLMNGGPFAYMTLGGKAVYDKLPDLFDLFDEILFEPLKDEGVAKERLGQMLLESKSRVEQAVQTQGHAFSGMRLGARYSAAGALAEMSGGISYLKMLRSYLADFAADPSKLLQALATIRQCILTSDQAIFSCTAEDSELETILNWAKKLTSKLPTAKASDLAHITPMSNLPSHEALITPSRVNFVAKSINLYQQGWQYHGSASVILRYMRMGYLWENVRVRGGAYGAFCSFDRSSGTLICNSFRDPNTKETLAAYDAMPKFLESFNPDKNQLTQAILGAVGDLDTYQLPSVKGATALVHHLVGDTVELRQKMREEMLATKASDFHRFGEAIGSLVDGDVCILGGQDAKSYAESQGWAQEEIF